MLNLKEEYEKDHVIDGFPAVLDMVRNIPGDGVVIIQRRFILQKPTGTEVRHTEEHIPCPKKIPAPPPPAPEPESPEKKTKKNSFLTRAWGKKKPPKPPKSKGKK